MFIAISANPTKFKKKTEKLRTLIKFNIKESEIIIHVSVKRHQISNLKALLSLNDKTDKEIVCNTQTIPNE